LEIVSFVDDPGLDLPGLALRLKETFRLPVRMSDSMHGLDFAYDPVRNQYLSTAILSMLLGIRSLDSTRVLAIVDVDLFIPILTYVFGEAQLGGTVAVVSAHRLRPASYGLPDDGSQVKERLVKEAVHELGHTFGLVHCPNLGCVLGSSTYPENIDLKEAEFCPACRALLDSRLPSH
jgi:archaemetzincin